MISKKHLLQPLAVAALLVAASGAQAALTTFSSSASFLAALSASGTDNFTGFNITGSTPNPITRNAGSFGYTADVGPTGLFFGGGTTANPFLSTNTATDTMSFGTFTGGVVSAIGGNFFGSNISGLFAAGAVTVVVTDSLGATVSTTINPSSEATGSFLGFTSNGTITSMTVAAVQPVSGFLWPSADNLTLGTVAAIPEPGTYAMFAAGLAALGFLARRRRG